MEKAVAGAKIEWKQNCLRHSFCSYAVALKGLEWTSDQADHSIAILKRDYREVVTKADADAYFGITVYNFDQLMPGNFALRPGQAAERLQVLLLRSKESPSWAT